MTIRQGNKIIAGNINVEDYNTLQNKPQINSVELSGNKTLEELGIQASGDYALKSTTLAGYGITDGLSTSQITNCITKIPQDIKFELVDGALTLKAGSKIYDGAGNPISIIKDYIVDITNSNGVVGVYYSQNQDKIWANQPMSLATSGNIPPEGTGMFYNTSTKSVDFYSNGSISDANWSLPLAIITTSNGALTTINQIFNGFGYIGSHWYELKGNKGEARNGRNTDGSLNNSTRTTTNVFVHTCGGGTGNWFMMSDFNGGFRNANKISYFIQDEMPSASSYSGNYAVWESPNENIIRITDNKGVTWTKTLFVNCGSYSTVDGRITSFNPKTVFHVADSNDTTWASLAGKPSNKYVDLTLNATGSSYTAPANGWVTFAKRANNANEYNSIHLEDHNCRWDCNATVANMWCSVSLPVKQNEKFIIEYTTSGELQRFRFIYDEGVK